MGNFIQGYPVFALLAFALLLMLVPLILLSIAWSIDETGRRLRIGAYILALVPPLLWLLAPAILAEMNRPRGDIWSALFDALCFRVEDWFMLPLGLLFLVFTMYVLVGVKNGQAYEDIFRPRRLVWFVFGLVVLFVVWFVPNTMLKAKAKFAGIHVELVEDVREAVEDIDFYSAQLNNSGYPTQLSEQARALKSTLDLIQTPIWADPLLLLLLDQTSHTIGQVIDSVAEASGQKLSKDTVKTVTGILDEVHHATIAAQVTARKLAGAAFVVGAEKLTEAAEDLQKQLEDISFTEQINTARVKVGAIANAEKENLEGAVQEAQEALEALQQTVRPVKSPVDGSISDSATKLSNIKLEVWPESGLGKETRNNILQTIAQMQVLVHDIQKQAVKLKTENHMDSSEKIWRINEVQDKARALAVAAAALRFDLATPFLMVSLLFVVFLLMPWLLYISFIVSKREQIVNDRLDLLRDLNLLERFRTSSSLSRNLTIEGANRARELVLSSQGNIADDVKNIVNNKRLSEESLAFKRAAELNTPTETEKDEITRLADTEILKRQTFHSREYLIPLIILTALTLVGWYYTIFATGTNGLVRFIEQGGGSAQLADLLARFTPFTMVFAGAWLFMIVMLTYRWVNSDLYPRSYFYASMRLVYGLLVGMVFLSLFGEKGDSYWLLVAFFVGTAPLEFVNALWKLLKDGVGWVKDNKINKEHANQIVKYFERPEWASRQPLTVLEEITVWDDTRFYQEGIMNVHALATSDLVRLAVRMPYDAQTLVDWVDQAILRIHTKVLWHSGMAAIGIRGATDLFDACADEQGRQSNEKHTCVVEAFNTAQLMSIGTDDPRYEAYNEITALKTAGRTLAEQAEVVKKANTKLDPTKDETLDNIFALRQQVNGLRSKATEAMSARQAAQGVLVSIIITDTASWADGGELDKHFKALTEGENSLITQAENAVKKEKLTRDMLEVDLTKEVNAEKPGQAALKKAQDAVKALVDPTDKTKKAVEAVGQQIDKTKTIKDELDALQGMIDAMITKAAAAKTQADKLTQANHAETTSKLEEVLAATKTAESAAGELVATAEARGDVFKTFKDKAAALKAALGVAADQLQGKINAAIQEVGKVVGDVNAVDGAKNTVAAVVTAVGSSGATGNDTIAGMMEAIAKPFKDVDTKLSQVIQKVTVLAADVKDAHTLAQSIKKDDAATWDNVKALVGPLSKLTKIIEDTETARRNVKKRLDKLDAQQTLVLREAREKVNNLPIDDAKEKAEISEKAFKDESNNVALSAGSSGLSEAKKKVDPAVTVAETLASIVNAVAEETMRIVLPLRLTKGILEVMLSAMKCDPNIHYIRHYWQVQIEKIRKVCEKLKQVDVPE
jgi:hypothetical protein